MRSESAGPTLTSRVIAGTVWMLAMRWVVRLLGLVNITVLARILTPEDFGIVAMAVAGAALPQAILDMGLEHAVLREKNPSAEVYNTAWSIRLLQMTALAVVIFLAAPIFAGFYKEPRLEAVARAIALVVFLAGLENIWVVAFRKEFNYGRDFAYNAIIKVLTVATTLAVALAIRSYWALVAGLVLSNVIRFIASLLMAPSVMRFSLAAWRSIWGFSQWRLSMGVASFSIGNSDRLILGRFAAADAVGLFSVARSLADLVVVELSAPFNRAFAPGIASIQDEPERLAGVMIRAVVGLEIACMPLSIGLALTADQLVPILLGAEWSGAIPILQIIALSGAPAALNSMLGSSLTMIGHVRLGAIQVWTRAVLGIGLGIPLVLRSGPIGLAYAILAAELVGAIVTLLMVRSVNISFRLRALFIECLRPVGAVLVMWTVLGALGSVLPLSALIVLFLKVFVGASAYLLVLLLLWVLQGRPAGLESMVLTKVAKTT